MLRIGIAGSSGLSGRARDLALAADVRSGMPFFLHEDQPLADELNLYLHDIERRELRAAPGLRRHAREILRWAVFLEVVQGKPLWSASSSDLHAYRRVLTDDGGRLDSRAWNASSAALAKLYHWAELNHLYRSDIEFRETLALRYYFPTRR